MSRGVFWRGKPRSCASFEGSEPSGAAPSVAVSGSREDRHHVDVVCSACFGAAKSVVVVYTCTSMDRQWSGVQSLLWNRAHVGALCPHADAWVDRWQSICKRASMVCEIWLRANPETRAASDFLRRLEHHRRHEDRAVAQRREQRVEARKVRLRLHRDVPEPWQHGAVQGKMTPQHVVQSAQQPQVPVDQCP